MVLTCGRKNCWYHHDPYGRYITYCRRMMVDNDEEGKCQSFMTEEDIAQEIVQDRARILILEPDLDIFAVLTVGD